MQTKEGRHVMSTDKPASSASASIHPGTHLGLVTLRVSELSRSHGFYEGVLGFQALEQTEGRVVLGGQDGIGLLELIEVAGAAPQPRRATGLYHVALLLPTRPDLGRVLLRLAQVGWQIGQGDHLVSEALYVSDPDGNGLELYRDRPKSTWKRVNGQIVMAVDPVDLAGLAEEGRNEVWEVLPSGTRIGHLHLQVGSIERARHFYHLVLGFDITADSCKKYSDL
jgi:catechol 2,3-dioxygenase